MPEVPAPPPAASTLRPAIVARSQPAATPRAVTGKSRSTPRRETDARRSRPLQPSTAPSEPSLPQAVGPDPVWTVQFRDAPVREVLSTLARCTGLEIVLTPGATGLVSVQLRGRTTDEAVRLVAAGAGLHAVRVEGTWFVGPPSEIRHAASEFGETQVLPLSHVRSETMRDWIGTVLPSVKADPVGNRLVLTGTAEDMAMAREVVRSLDKAPLPEPPVRRNIAVTKADPQALERKASATYAQLGVRREGEFIVLEGPRIAVDEAEKAIGGWDVASAPAQVHRVATLRYVHAERAAESLRKAFPSLSIVVAPEPAAPPAAQFNPLGGGFSAGAGSAGNPSGAGGTGTGANAMGAGRIGDSQPISRSTRLFLAGPADLVERASSLLESTDVPAPMVRIEASVFEVDQNGQDENGFLSTLSGEIRFVIPGGKGVDLEGSDLQRSELSVGSALRGLVVRNKARLLAQPSMSVVDNEDANIFIGDMVRFRGSTFTPGTGGVVQGIETIPVGIALLLRPRIHPSGDVTLKVHPVVGSLVEDDGNGLPRTSSREADTTVRLRPGEELVIGGLDREEKRATWRRLPVLGTLPLVGSLFRGRTQRSQKTRIVVVLRASPLTGENSVASPLRSRAIPEDLP